MTDYYAILGLKPGAPKEEIKRAYRRLAMQWHPDRNPSPEARQKFILLTEAYDALMSGKTFATFVRTGQRASATAPRQKTRDEILREKRMAYYENYDKKFRAIRAQYRNPSTAPRTRESMYGEIYSYFAAAGGTLLFFILLPFLLGNPGLLIILFPIGLGAGLKIFWHGGRKKYRADMIFGREENYSFEELRDFFDERPVVRGGYRMWG